MLARGASVDTRRRLNPTISDGRGCGRGFSPGRLNGWHRFELDSELVSQKCDGHVAQRLLSEKLGGKTWAVDNFEVGTRESKHVLYSFRISTQNESTIF